MRFTVDRLDHIVLHCRDLKTMASWYQLVLGMDAEAFEVGRERRTALKFGGQKINLRPIGADERHWVTSPVVQPGVADLCFVTAVGSAEVVQHLWACGVAVLEGPVERRGALGPMMSVYCRDPEGNLIEIASYLTD